jgi:hypothetical protein
MKTGKELKINNFKDFNVVFGSINNKHPKAIYINISSWVEPKENININYIREIKNINKKLKQTLFNYFESDKDSIFEKNNTIVDLDIRESGIKFGKRSFMNCEITLFLTTEIQANSDKMKDILQRLTPLIIDEVFKPNEIFNFNVKKL